MKRLFFVSLFVIVLQFGAFAQISEFDSGMKSAKNGDFQIALSHFQNSINQKLSAKKLSQIHYNLGVCLYQLKQSEKAVAEFEQAINLNPNYEKAFYALGMAKTELKIWNEAETAFRQSLKLSNNGETWFDLALVLFELRKYDESAESFQNAVKFGSQAIAASHNNLGVIYALKGDLTLAKNELETAGKLNFEEAVKNLEILRQAIKTDDKTLISKLILKENK